MGGVCGVGAACVNGCMYDGVDSGRCGWCGAMWGARRVMWWGGYMEGWERSVDGPTCCQLELTVL